MMFPLLSKRLFIQMAIAGMFGTTKRVGQMETCESCKGTGRHSYEGGRYVVYCGPCNGSGEVPLKRCAKCREIRQDVDPKNGMCRNCDVVIPAG